MTNHFHLLVRLPAGGLSAAMQHVTSVYTRHTNDRIGRDGPLFRGRFHSIPAMTDLYLLWVTRYIHRNALDLPGISRPDDYRWSSYRTYLGHRQTPSFMRVDPILDHFGGDRRALAEFTLDERHDAVGGSAQGDIDAATIRSIVSFAIASDDLSHDDCAAPQRLAHTIAVLLLDSPIDSRTRTAIEADLEFPSATARRMAISRARRRVAAEPSVARVLDAVVSRLHVAECA